METNNLTSKSTSNLNEAAKWANILALIGFGSMALSTISFLYILFLGTGLPIGGARIGITFLVFAILMVLNIIPYLYMYKFAQGVKNSDVDSGIEYLKSYFKFVSIFTIVMVSLSILSYLILYALIS
jgi:hypothetical protein